jgi:hypothetical protein
MKLNNQIFKINYQHMINRIQKLKIKMKRLNKMNNVDNTIDILDKNFNEEKRLNKMKKIDDAINNLDVNFNEKKMTIKTTIKFSHKMMLFSLIYSLNKY